MRGFDNNTFLFSSVSFPLKIRAGITWAFLGVFASVLLVILVYCGALCCHWIGDVFLMPHWTFARVYSAFVIVGIGGFAFGITKGCRHTAFINTCFSSALFFGCATTFILYFFYQYCMHVERPQKIKIVDCTNKVTQVSLQVPIGRIYTINYTLSNTAYSNSGVIRFLNGSTTITNFPVDQSSGTKRCEFLRGMTNCDIQITFDRDLSSSLTLWLSWLEAYKDWSVNKNSERVSR